jgi:hypothetical protein
MTGFVGLDFDRQAEPAATMIGWSSLHLISLVSLVNVTDENKPTPIQVLFENLQSF